MSEIKKNERLQYLFCAVCLSHQEKQRDVREMFSEKRHITLLLFLNRINIMKVVSNDL